MPHMLTEAPKQHRIPEALQHSGAVCRRQQLVVIPFHQHERVTGAEKLFEQPWGVEQVLAQAYVQLTQLGLFPARVFRPGNDQWLYAEAGTDQERAERMAQRVDRQLQAMHLPVIAFAQTVVPVTPPRLDGSEE
jgi:hypothetical protein